MGFGLKNNVLCDGTNGRPTIPTYDNLTGEPTGNYLSIEQTVYDSIRDIVFHVIKYKQDYVFIIDGEPGSGKTTFGSHLGTLICHFVNEEIRKKRHREFRKYLGIKRGWKSTFTAQENYVYTSVDFINKVKTLPPFSVVEFDEATATADRKSAMSANNRNLGHMLAAMREGKHMFAVVMLPDINDLDYSIVKRANAWFNFQKKKHVLKSGRIDMKPGHYLFFGKNGIKLKYRLMKKGKYDNPRSVQKVFYMADKHYTVDINHLRAVKEETIQRYGEDYDVPSPASIKAELLKDIVLRYEEEGKPLMFKQCLKILGIAHTTYYKYRNDLRASGLLKTES